MPAGLFTTSKSLSSKRISISKRLRFSRVHSGRRQLSRLFHLSFLRSLPLGGHRTLSQESCFLGQETGPARRRHPDNLSPNESPVPAALRILRARCQTSDSNDCALSRQHAPSE